MPPKKIVYTTQAALNAKVSAGKSVRVGYTNDAGRRASEYARGGLGGTMYVAPTTNGRQAEQRLLNNQFNNSKTNLNVQHTSNISIGKSGFVYYVAKSHK